MANRAGLRKVTKSVRGKHGSVQRSYWVKTQQGLKSFAKRHKTALAVGAGLISAGLAYHHRAAIGSYASTGSKTLTKHFGTTKARSRTFAKAGRAVGKFAKSEFAKEIFDHFGEAAGAAVGARMAGGRRGMMSKSGIAGGTVGAIVGRHLVRGITSAGVKRLTKR